MNRIDFVCNCADSIYVRAFENRIDLLRAVMVGASGTPYHDGLFFFDLLLPPSYPDAPSQVCYHSFGLRLNPNLYASGIVCLSLLNTFGGEGTEIWSPSMSSLLQVLVSIQGLVLNNSPTTMRLGMKLWSAHQRVAAMLCRTTRMPTYSPCELCSIYCADHLWGSRSLSETISAIGGGSY